MTASIFNIRRVADFGVANTAYTAGKWDLETKVIYLLGVAPQTYFNKFKDPESDRHAPFQQFLKSRNLTGADQQTVAEEAATELSRRIVTPELIDKIGNNIADQIEKNPHRNFDKVKIICPFPIEASQTHNEFAPALNAMVTARLEEGLPRILAARGLKSLPVYAELDPEHSSPDSSILNIVRNDRGSTSNPEPGKEGLTYIERLVRQPVYSGDVDKNAIYVPVDDFLVAQSTLCALVSYVQSGGGVTTNAVTGCELFTGIRVMAPQQATLDYLNTAIAGTPREELALHNGPENYKKDIQKLMARTGLAVDFDNLKANTLSNVEMMFLAGVLADPHNEHHKTAFENTLHAIGSTAEEAKGNSPSDIFHAKRISLKELKRHFTGVLESRKPLITPEHTRFRALTDRNQLVDFALEA